MEEKIKTASAWLFVCFFLLLGLDDMTGGLLGMGKLLTAAIAPVREELSFLAQIGVTLIFAAIATLPAYFCLIPVLLPIKDQRIQIAISAFAGLLLSGLMVFG